MDRKSLILIGILAICVLISGCVDNSKTDNQQKEETTSLPDCEKTITTEEWNSCIVKVASANYDISICKEIKYPSDTYKEDTLKRSCIVTVEENMYSDAVIPGYNEIIS